VLTAVEQDKNRWLMHAQRLADVALEIIGQCDRLDVTKGTKDPRVIALALLSRSLGHFRAIFRMLEAGSVTEARTLTRCIFENLFMLGALVEGGDAFVQKMVDDHAKSRQSRGTWVLGWLDEQDAKSPHEDTLRETSRFSICWRRPVFLAKWARSKTKTRVNRGVNSGVAFFIVPQLAF